MQIVIDIDDNKLWEIKNEPIKKNFNIYELASYIDKGVPLPKGHGRLIDAEELKTAFPCGESVRTECVRATIDYAPTIIEADKTESEE